MIERGEIIEAGQVWSVFSAPQQPLTQELLNFEQLDLPFALHKLPDAHSTQLILKLRYAAPASQSPDLKAILNQLDGPVQLYQSHVDTIQQHLVGALIVAVPAAQLDISALQQKLKQHIAQIEVLGYARPAH